jgi:hypothetical protein
MKVPELAFERALGMSPAALAEYAETAAKTHAALQATAHGQPQPVDFYSFLLRCFAELNPRSPFLRIGTLRSWRRSFKRRKRARLI